MYKYFKFTIRDHLLKKARTTQPHKWYPFVEMGQVEKKPQMVSKTFKNALYKVKVAFVG